MGCSGWNYRDWRGVLYPDGCPQRRWLSRYAEAFDTVEVNATFYRLPTRSAVEGWVAQAPPGFVLAVKASRYLTHVKRLRDMEQGVARLWERLEPLTTSAHMGPVLWQLPATFHRDDERLAHWLAHCPRAATCSRCATRAGWTTPCSAPCASAAWRCASPTIPSGAGSAAS